MLIETADRGERTATGPLGPRPRTSTAQAMDSQQSRPWPQHHMQRTLDEPPNSRSRSRPQGLEGKLQDDGEPQSVAPAVKARVVPLETGIGRDLTGMTGLHPDPQGSVLPEKAR